MGKLSLQRLSAILFFGMLLAGALFCALRLKEDIALGKYFSNPEELRYDIIFLTSYAFIVLFILRYGYYLAINKVQWRTLKDDYLYLLSKKYFTKTQWLINILLFWLALSGFFYSLTISTMQGNL
ncbi:MAG: hypothetical protein JW714_03425 [Candidatus Omnitrophica bacterium]|nr:hypothetical protein [Candidatus Omnitrophota bacterium]